MDSITICWLCNQFASPSLKGVLRHIAAVHSWEPNFFTVCGIHGCTRTYSNFFSFKKHAYRKHRDVLDTAVRISPLYTNEMVDQDLINSEENFQQNDSMCTSTISTPVDDKQNSALFILKSKVMYKIPQVHLEHLIGDVNELFERKVDILRKMLFQELDNHGIQISHDVNDSLTEIITKTLSNPFSGLETNYLQLKFFQEYFGVIVSINLSIIIIINFVK